MISDIMEVAALDPDADIPFVDDAPAATRAPPNIQATQGVKWLQLVFNGSSLVAEVALVISGWSGKLYNVSRVMECIGLILQMPIILTICRKFSRPSQSY